VPIQNAPTCSRRGAALAVYAKSRDCPRCPGNRLNAGVDGDNVPNSTARKLTEPVQWPARFIGDLSRFNLIALIAN